MNMGFFSLALMGVFIFGCRNHDEQIFLEVVGLDKTSIGNYALQIVRADPNDNPIANKGSDLDLNSDVKIFLDEIPKVAKKTYSFRKLKDNLDQQFGGKPVSLLYSKKDGVYYGSTYESLLGLSAYYHLVEIIKFARSKSMLDDMDRGPLKISLYGEIYANRKNPFPYPTNDNALYIGSADVMMLLPLGDNDGLPVTMHEGVLAHEYHHRIFFNQVWINAGFDKSWRRYQARYDDKDSPSVLRSERLLSATDEGLADIFAVAYTGLPNYLSLSLTTGRGEQVSAQRGLEGRFAAIATYDALAKKNLPKYFQDICSGSDNFTDKNFNYYCLATVIAKAIYETSGPDIEILKEKLLPAIFRSLSSIAKALSKGQDYDVHIFFEALANDLKVKETVLFERLCEQLMWRFSSLIYKGKIPSCKKK